MKSKPAAFALWMLGFFGLCGLHRLYLGKVGSGIVWFLTWGLFFVGQIADLFLLSRMVDRENAGRQAATVPVGPVPRYVPEEQAPAVREVIREREIIVVKVRCDHCRMLVDPRVPKCPNCGAPVR